VTQRDFICGLEGHMKVGLHENNIPPRWVMTTVKTPWYICIQLIL